MHASARTDGGRHALAKGRPAGSAWRIDPTGVRVFQELASPYATQWNSILQESFRGPSGVLQESWATDSCLPIAIPSARLAACRSSWASSRPRWDAIARMPECGVAASAALL